MDYQVKQNGFTFFENIVIDHIDLDAYGKSNELDLFDKVLFVYETFQKEYGHETKRIGTLRAFSEWLQGLPSILTVPFYYYQQIELAKSYYGESFLSSDESETNFCDGWFINCARAFFTLKDNL